MFTGSIQRKLRLSPYIFPFRLRVGVSKAGPFTTDKGAVFTQQWRHLPAISVQFDHPEFGIVCGLRFGIEIRPYIVILLRVLQFSCMPENQHFYKLKFNLKKKLEKNTLRFRCEFQYIHFITCLFILIYVHFCLCVYQQQIALGVYLLFN